MSDDVREMIADEQGVDLSEDYFDVTEDYTEVVMDETSLNTEDETDTM